MLEWLFSSRRATKRLSCSPLKDYLISYLVHLTEQRYRPSTMRMYAGRLLCFGEYLGKQNCCDVTQFSQAVEPFLRFCIKNNKMTERNGI